MQTPNLPFIPASHTIPNNTPALCDDSGKWLDYGTMREKIHVIAPVFRSDAKGLIFCCLPQSNDGVLAYLAAASTGHAVGMANLNMPNLPALMQAYEPEWITISGDARIEGYEQIEWALPGIRLLRRTKASTRRINSDLYLLLLTSGSTGSSKGVRLSYKNIGSNTHGIINSLSLAPDTRALAHLPLHYSFGLSVLHSQLAIGGSCVLTEHGMMSKEFWQLARTQEANLFAGVPYHYEMLAKLGLDRIDCPKLKIFLQAGGKLQEDLTQSLWQQIQKRDGRLFVMYGQTEASPRMSCLAVHDYPEKIGTCGLPLEGGNFSIENGEVSYSGPNVMLGYAQTRADLALDDNCEYRLKTGDIGELDKDGYLTITGRKQRFAKLYGQRIALDDIEKIATQISPAIAIDVGEKIILVITQNDKILHDKMRAVVARKTGLQLAWFETRAVSEIPHTSAGKVDYHKLREML